MFQNKWGVYVHDGVVFVVDQPVEHVVMGDGVCQVFRRFPVEYREVNVHIGDAKSFWGRRDNTVALEQAARVVVHEAQTPETHAKRTS